MSFLLQEDGTFLLQETGDKIILDELALVTIRLLASLGVGS